MVQESPLDYKDGKMYSKGYNFTCMATSGDGFVAVGQKVRGGKHCQGMMATWLYVRGARGEHPQRMMVVCGRGAGGVARSRG